MILQKRNPYVTQLQKERLVDYVASNYEILYGKQPYTTETSKDELWNLMAVELNNIGAIKDVLGWKRCCASLKSSTTRKLKTSEVPNELNSLQSKIIQASHLAQSPGNSVTPQKKEFNTSKRARCKPISQTGDWHRHLFDFSTTATASKVSWRE